MTPGTLNVSLSERYVVTADALIHSHEYFTGETLKFQRCRVPGFRMFIMRPDSHELMETGPGDYARVIELVSPLKLREAWGLKDGSILEVQVEGDEQWWTTPEPLSSSQQAGDCGADR